MSNSDPENRRKLNRRQALLLPATVGMGAALAGPAKASDSTKTAAHQEPGTCSTPRSAIANTQYGKVRGFLDGGVFTFKGIPYGQDTSPSSSRRGRFQVFSGRTGAEVMCLQHGRRRKPM